MKVISLQSSPCLMRVQLKAKLSIRLELSSEAIKTMFSFIMATMNVALHPATLAESDVDIIGGCLS